jgi:hypothetical protein
MTNRDREILRDLAEQVAEVAAQPRMAERKERWYAQNSLQPGRPLVYASPEGSWIELLPEEVCCCQDDDARSIEGNLRMRLYAAEHFDDDQVCDAIFRVPRALQVTGWGVEPVYTRPEAARGAYVWDPPIKTHADLDRLQTPQVTHDPEATAHRVEFYEDLFGGLLEIELSGNRFGSCGLIDEWTRLRGIEQTFWDMTDDPKMVHEGMSRLRDGKLALMESLESQGLLTLNNGNHYTGSGAWGFCRELPQPDFEGTVRLKDLWGFAEAQTMSEVSPAMHEEFVLEYELPLLERLGLNCYGCCEPLHRHLDTLKRRVPNLRRVSISPWADRKVSAEKLGSGIIYNWKPNPAALAAVEFDADWVRQDIRQTVDLARANGCVLEMVMKDTHTCNRQPWRFDEWTRIAMEEAERW